MYCQNCGIEINEEQEVCSNCGSENQTFKKKYKGKEKKIIISGILIILIVLIGILI